MTSTRSAARRNAATGSLAASSLARAPITSASAAANCTAARLPRTGAARVDPGEALLEMLWASYGQVGWLGEEINKLDDLTTFEARVLVQSHKDERDRTARIAAMALQAGVNERAIRLAELYGYQIARLIQGILGNLNLTGAQQKLVPQAVRANLMAIDDSSDRERPAIEGVARRAG